MEQEHQKQNEINYSVEVEKDGRKYVLNYPLKSGQTKVASVV